LSKADLLPNNTVVRIYNAVLYIEENLEKKLLLNDVAKKAHFSPFHFHRLFSLVTRETFNSFIVRKRMETAASYLLHRKEKQITEIAEKIGFSDISSFSKAFKKFYGISPSKFKEQSPEKYSKISKTESKNGTITTVFEQYLCNINNALNWLQMNTKTTIKTIETLNLAYLSHKGKMDEIGLTFNELVKWSVGKGLMSEKTRMLTIYHDSPKITEPNNIRMSACIILNEPIQVNGEVQLRTFTPNRCIVSHMEISPSEFQQAWEANFAFMMEKGYQKSDIAPFEVYYNNAEDHPENKFIVDLCIPIL
jgi:AraC family transcriptional regulator